MNSDPRLVLILALLASLVVRGPVLVTSLTPSPGVYLDFVQEWLSARSYWHGQPVYRPQLPVLAEYTGVPAEQLDLRLTWNAHPPAAVLLALPFGLYTNYYDAHLAWSLVSVAALGLSLLIMIQQINADRFLSWLIASIITLWSDPLYINLHYGQLGCPLLLLMTLAWWADRRNWPVLAGLAAGLAISVKLFPGLFFVYFFAARRWMALLSSSVSVALYGLGCLMIFGPRDLQTYVQQVLPSLDVFRAEWINLSVAEALSRTGVLLGWTGMGRLGGLVARILVLALLLGCCWRATETWQRDRAFMLTILAMLLLSPVVWTHYLILLALPCGLMLGSARLVVSLVVVVLLNLPLLVPASLVMTEPQMDLLSQNPTRVTVQGIVTLLPYQIGLVGLFGWLAWWRGNPNPASSS